MSGYYIVCNHRTNGVKCSVTISGETKEELLKEALHHMSSVHGMKESRGLKDQLKAGIKKGKKAA